ncbi:Metalloprotease [Punctularia strigosozonata HHB-11173 SS5]|uniref:Metalloprotease n=1 Tax=Punctularia strigosozonata (strain HHB-11173) TaxID=741275 RepID=UPI000441677F|nr:Metalloprotease [Punctularia strigosozonata HHB-11173 SS5]EIN07764.1 Metalloprotease [Punctularia strigosozonata HHB-11173 SS5]
MAEPRPSTDEETAPLLNDGTSPAHEEPTFAERVAAVFDEPLTALTKVLIVLVVLFLLLASIFIGLFAGAQHKLNTGKGDTPGESVTTTVVTTATATTTDVQTTTISAPIPGPTDAPEEKVCLTPSCITLSAEILASLDTSVDPCESLYDFATGGWRKAHPIPAGKGSFESFGELAVKNKQVIHAILEPAEDTNSLATSVSLPDVDEEAAMLGSPADKVYDTLLLKKLRWLYGSCMDEDYLDEVGAAPLLKVTDTVRKLFNGSTTIVDAASAEEGGLGKEKNLNLTAAIAFLHSKGIPVIFDVEVDGDAGVDPDAMTLWFTQSDFGLPSKEYFEEDDIVALYQSVIERLLEYLYQDTPSASASLSASQSSLVVNDEAGTSYSWPPWPWPPWGDDDDDEDLPPAPKPINFTQLAADVVTFEKRLAAASLALDKLYQDPFGTYNPTPIANLTLALPQIAWGEYFASMTPRAYPAIVIETYPAYPAKVSEILAKTEGEVVAAYFVARAALALAPNLGYGTVPWKVTRELTEELQGIKKGAVPDRSEWCIGKVESSLGFAAGRYFVNETFTGDSREKATKVITDIVGAFKKSLEDVEWMDEESAKAAAEKADALRVKVGFPMSPNTLDPRSLYVYYQLVRVNQSDFFGNMLNSYSSDVYKKWQKLGKRRDHEEWEMWPSMVNAYYNPPGNEIVFPAGILQPPFFSQDWPAYMAYGSFGMVAAHELTHAFDSAGRMYNQQGKLEEWWTNATSAAFNERAECISKQYSNYTVDDGKGGVVHVNGNLTSGENIGDSGLIQSYRAWKAQYADSLRNGNEYVLPGLGFTKDQLFFISFARTWAQNIKPASAVARVRTDPHSPNRYRTDGTVSNIPEFAKAFNCSAKAKLNPPDSERCLLWN